MNLMRFEPAGVFRRDLDRIFGGPACASETRWVPPADIREDKDRFAILLDVPGVDPSDIDIAVENGVLTLSGSRKSEHAEDHKGYRRVERASGKFVRRFTLPDDVDVEAVTAHSENGVLEVRIPKSPRSQPRRVEITVN